MKRILLLTLHSRSGVWGSAVQSNSSVSAMPPYLSRTFEAPVHPGTADTLLLRSAVMPITVLAPLVLASVICAGCAAQTQSNGNFVGFEFLPPISDVDPSVRHKVEVTVPRSEERRV